MSKTYTLKLSSNTAYKLYDGATLVSDTDLGTLFGAAGEDYFVFDFNSATPSDLTQLSITDSSDAAVMGITGLAAGTIKENYNFKGTWDGTSTTFSTFTQLSGQALDEVELSFLMSKIKEAGPGKARVLTTDDYNYPTSGTKTSVAIWLLEPGLYTVPASGVNVLKKNDTAISNASVLIAGKDAANWVTYSIFTSDSAVTGYVNSYGTSAIEKSLITNVTDNLTSTSTTNALSANQGKVLKNLVDSLAFKNAGAPTTSTVGTVGQLLEDTTNGKLYICTDATNPYVWEEVGGSAGPTVVQSTGTSTTSVMSQNAVTSMVFADPSTQYKIKIGAGTSSSEGANGVEVGHSANASGTQAVALGYNTVAKGSYNVAIGSGSGHNSTSYSGTIALGSGSGNNITATGMADIGTYDTSRGYNSSNYRLLTGLYDGQSAHDAVNKGQLDTAIINGGTTAPTTATVGAVGTLYSYVDTTGTPTPHMMVCTAVDTTDPSNPVYTWSTLI